MITGEGMRGYLGGLLMPTLTPWKGQAVESMNDRMKCQNDLVQGYIMVGLSPKPSSSEHQ